MIAKNVGIRRSRGEYVLGTNLDIVFSSELMQFLAARQLDPGAMYRIDRHDVSSEIPAEATLDELLSFCHGRMLRVFTREGGFALTPGGLHALEQHDIVEPDAGIHFGSGWYRPESDSKEWFRWIGIEAEFYFEKPRWASPQLLIDAEVGPSSGGEPLTLEITGGGGSWLASGRMDGRCQIRLQLPDGLSTGALRLRTFGGGLPLEHQSRILNLRIFKVEWVTGAGKTSASWGLEDRELSISPQPSQIRPAARSTAPLDMMTDSAITISNHGRPAWSAASTSSACPAEDTKGGQVGQDQRA